MIFRMLYLHAINYLFFLKFLTRKLKEPEHRRNWDIKINSLKVYNRIKAKYINNQIHMNVNINIYRFNIAFDISINTYFTKCTK